MKTRNVPENFNEAKFVGFAMYTTCVIWIAFVPIYFGSESKVNLISVCTSNSLYLIAISIEQIITLCVCISLSAMVTLVFLFLPKFYIIIFHPEKNIRALFTTSKSIRCHIGSRVASAISHKTTSSYSSHPDEYEREYIFERKNSLFSPITIGVLNCFSFQNPQNLLYDRHQVKLLLSFVILIFQKKMKTCHIRN